MNPDNPRFPLPRHGSDHGLVSSAVVPSSTNEAMLSQGAMADNEQQTPEHILNPFTANHRNLQGTRVRNPVIRSDRAGRARTHLWYQANEQQTFDRVRLRNRSPAAEAVPLASRAVCDVCNYTFENDKELRKHIERVHRL